MGVRVSVTVLLLLLFGAGSLAQTGYFPPGALTADSRNEEFLSSWYTQELNALQEPSLWALSKTQKEQSYRFLWLRTFHHPVAFELMSKRTAAHA